MLSFFLAAFVHLAILGGIAGSIGHGALQAPAAPAPGGHARIHTFDSAGGPPPSTTPTT